MTIQVSFNLPDQDYVFFLNNVTEKVQTQVERQIPNVSRGSKRVVLSKLVKGYGVETGIYKSSFRINNFSENKWTIGFQVYARKPHYRLTHLLEDGHRSIQFRWGRGRPTKYGRIGMNLIHSDTKHVTHIEPGQKYADDKVIELYNLAITTQFKERMKVK